MAGRHYSKDDFQMIISLKEEGSTYREIADRLGRSEAGIRNQLYRKGITERTRSEVCILNERKEKLESIIEALNHTLKELQDQQVRLSDSVKVLRQELARIQQLLKVSKIALCQSLKVALTELKQKRPDLFMLNRQEQMVAFTNFFLKILLKK